MAAKIIRPRKLVRNPDQLPLITPESSWVRPAELPDLRRVKKFALDTETLDHGLNRGLGPGWALGAGHVAGVSVAWRGNGNELHQTYVPVRHPDTDNFDVDQVGRWLNDCIDDETEVVFQNAPYDVGWLHADLKVRVPRRIHDVGCMAVMINETHFSYTLNAICKRLGIDGKDETLLREAADVYGFDPNNETEVKKAIARMPARYCGIYAGRDAGATLEAEELQRPELWAQGLVQAYELEMDLIPLTHAMRTRGIRMDVDRIQQCIDELYAQRDQCLAELRRRMGYHRDVHMEDIRSATWLPQVFDQVGVEYEQDSGKASFNRDWMRQGYVGRYQRGKEGHWLPQLIARAKQCHDAADKFLRGFLLDFCHNGRIHATINQFLNEEGGTRTHRFSYADPPLQQMPSRPEKFMVEWTLTADIAKMIRACFLPERGEKWFSPDYSQQEYRLMVHYAAVLGCAKADWAAQRYVDDVNTDFHNMVVDMTGLERRTAKDVNFAKSYGAGVKKFALMTGMTNEDASATMEQYDGNMPFIKQLNERCDKAAARRGYIVMLDGARMHFETWEPAKWIDWDKKREAAFEGQKLNDCSREEAVARTKDKSHLWFGMPLKRANTRKAMNALIQGGSARMGKHAMRDMWRAGYVPLLQMHDEFPNSVGSEKDGKAIAEIMRGVGAKFGLRVPFRVDEEYGKNWADAKHAWDKAEFAA